MHNFVQRSRVGIFCDKIYPIRPQAHIFGRFGLFCYYTNFGAKRAELVQLTHKFVQRSRSEFFATNAPDLPYWTQTHVLWRFKTFRYCCNFGAKWNELVQLVH
jgi:hypothetical protein